MALSEQQKDILRHPVRWFKSHGPEEIPRKELLGILLATVGQSSMFGMAGANWFFHFCTNVLMLDPRIVGVMTGVFPLYDAVVDPVVGVAIDSHQFRDGRKLVPWIRSLAPFAAVTALLLFVSWGFQSVALKALYCIAVYLVWDTLNSFLTTSLSGVTAAISPHSMQRARAVQWQDIGLTIGSFFPELLLPMLSVNQETGKAAFGMSQRQVYLLFGFIMCFAGGLLYLSATGVTERVRNISSGAEKNPFKKFAVLRHNHILLLFVLFDLLRNAAPFISEGFVYQQVSYPWFGGTIKAGTLVTVLVIFAGLPGTGLKFAATKVIEKVGSMKRVLVIAVVTDIACRVAGWAIGIGTIPRLILVFVIEAVNNIPWGVFGIAQKALIADSVDYVEWKTGERTEGVTMSARNLTVKLASAARRFMMGQTLGWLRYDAELVSAGVPQGPIFQKWSWAAYKLGVAGGGLLCLIPLLLLKYPDALKRQVESDLAERRAINIISSKEAPS
ncbi:MAG: MFS transporter [Oscillospiraceae bacterium]|nr:MFS transporter [Oscillospiraceae bacterium]